MSATKIEIGTLFRVATRGPYAGIWRVDEFADAVARDTGTAYYSCHKITGKPIGVLWPPESIVVGVIAPLGQETT